MNGRWLGAPPGLLPFSCASGVVAVGGDDRRHCHRGTDRLDLCHRSTTVTTQPVVCWLRPNKTGRVRKLFPDQLMR
jgi:hypothetical protein